jgi:hypothetical protein
MTDTRSHSDQETSPADLLRPLNRHKLLGLAHRIGDSATDSSGQGLCGEAPARGAAETFASAAPCASRPRNGLSEDLPTPRCSTRVAYRVEPTSHLSSPFVR